MQQVAWSNLAHDGVGSQPQLQSYFIFIVKELCVLQRHVCKYIVLHYDEGGGRNFAVDDLGIPGRMNTISDTI